jgi:hypothetical protein
MKACLSAVKMRVLLGLTETTPLLLLDEQKRLALLK